MTGLLDFLRACAETERLARDFYSALAGAFPAHPEACALFRRLSDEEEAHARTFDFLRSVAKEHEGRVEISPSFEENVERLRRGVAKAKDAVLSGAGLSLEDALGWALLIEATTIERDKRAFVRVEDSEFQSLLGGLVVGDDGHQRQLVALRTSLAGEAEEAKLSA